MKRLALFLLLASCQKTAAEKCAEAARNKYLAEHCRPAQVVTTPAMLLIGRVIVATMVTHTEIMCDNGERFWR